MKKNAKIFLVLNIILLFACESSIGKINNKNYDCTNGTPQVIECKKALILYESKLNNINYKIQKIGVAQLKTSYPNDYVLQFIKNMKNANLQWIEFRNKQCLYEMYFDGVSEQYLPAMIASCKLNMTQNRIKILKNKFILNKEMK